MLQMHVVQSAWRHQLGVKFITVLFAWNLLGLTAFPSKPRHAPCLTLKMFMLPHSAHAANDRPQMVRRMAALAMGVGVPRSFPGTCPDGSPDLAQGASTLSSSTGSIMLQNGRKAFLMYALEGHRIDGSTCHRHLTSLLRP